MAKLVPVGLLVAQLLGCGAKSFSFSVDPASAAASTSTVVTLNIEVKRDAGFISSLTIDLVDPPATIQADPLTIIGTQSTATLTLHVGAQASGSIILTIRASGGGIVRTQSATLVVSAGATAQSTAISGSVFDGAGRPLGSVNVTLGDGSQTKTDSGGKFSFPQPATASYDVTLISADTLSAAIFQGITRLDPTLTFLPMNSGAVHHVFVQGALTGGANGGSNTLTSTVAFGATDSNQQYFQSIGASYAALANWTGDSTSDTFTLHAIQTESTGGTFVGFAGYGSRTVQVTDGNSASGEDVSIPTAITSASLTGSAAIPSGYTASTDAAWASWSDKAAMPVATSSGATFTLANIPVLPGAIYSVLSVATKSSARTATLTTNVTLPSAPLSLVLIDAPEVTLPAPGATLKAGDKLTWTSPSQALSLVIIEDITHNSVYLTYLTASSQMTVPDLATAGHAYPQSASLIVQVLALSPAANIDEYCGVQGLTSTLFVADQLMTAYPLPFVSHGFPSANVAVSLSGPIALTSP